jgi:hypothetical protein
MLSLTGPADTSDGTIVIVNSHKLRSWAIRWIPQVQGILKGNGHHIFASPIQHVKIVIINHSRGI